MHDRYAAAFLVPIPSQKVLGDYGWEFQSDKRLPTDVKKFLLDTLRLHFTESTSGMLSYSGEGIKATVFLDEQEEIEHVYFRIYDVYKEQLLSAFESSAISSCAELFFPSLL